nr:MAG TPA: hypothetical protein [Caudoviricetes sp.]
MSSKCGRGVISIAQGGQSPKKSKKGRRNDDSK